MMSSQKAEAASRSGAEVGVAAHSTPAPPRAERRRYERDQVTTAAVLLAPALMIIGVFVLYPSVSALYLSLTDWGGFSADKQFVGLANYLALIRSDEFWNSLLVTVVYAAGVCFLSVASGLTLALLLDAPLRGRGFYRTVYFLPTVTSSVAVAIVWRYMLNPAGYVNTWLAQMGIEGPDWLQNRWTALAALILLTVWKNLGINMILYLTALQSLPASVYEASQLDGAGISTRLRYITIPLLRPMTFFVVVQALITSFQSFDLVYVFTAGGPQGGTEVLGMYMYREAFRMGNMGYGTAISFVTLILVLAITLGQWRVNRAGGSDLK